MGFGKQYGVLLLLCGTLFLLSPQPGRAQPSLTAPILDPISVVQVDGILPLTWSNVTFHAQVNRTLYEVHCWSAAPQWSVGNWYPTTHALNISVSYFRTNGLYKFVVRAVEETFTVNNFGEETVTQRIESPWSNMESILLSHIIEPSPSARWQGTYWEKSLVTPGVVKTIIYTEHQYFYDTVSGTWKSLDFRENPDFYLARNAQVGVRFRNAYTEIFNVAENITRVGAERWRIQGYVGEAWVFLNLTNTQRSYKQTVNWINLTRTQDIVYNAIVQGSMNSTLSLGKGMVKYTIQVIANKTGTIRLIWEFANIAADQIKYLQNTELIGDKIINARKITFHDADTFAFYVDWFDVPEEEFLYCRAFKQGENVIARAFFGNWTIAPGVTITLDPSLTTITPPSDDIDFYDWDVSDQVGSQDWISFIKFDISSILDETQISSAILKLYLHSYATATGFSGNVEIARTTNQTWTEDDSTGLSVHEKYTMMNMTVDNQENITISTTQDEWKALTITDILTADFDASNTNCTIRLRSPDEASPTSTDEAQGGTAGSYWLYIGDISGTYGGFCSSENLYGSYYYPYLEIYTASAGPESETGVTVDLSTQPHDIIPREMTAWKAASGNLWGTESFRAMEVDDGEATDYSWTAGGGNVVLRFYSNYWKSSDILTYDLQGPAEGTSETITLTDYNPAVATIETNTSDSPIISGTHSLEIGNWKEGWLELNNAVSNGDGAWANVYIDQLLINFTAISDSITLQRSINGTQVLEYFEWAALEPNDTLTITSIPTSYALADIYPTVDYTDTISASGQLILTNTTVTRYHITFDTGSTIHRLHMAHNYPDGLGTLATWDEVKWYLNDTQVEHNDYLLFSGYYELEIYDYYNQLIKSDTLNLTSTDAFLQRHELDLSLYFVAFHNGDLFPYNIQITRNEVTREWTAPPKGESSDIRLYGLAAGVAYDIVVINKHTGEVRDSYSISVSTYPVSIALEYEPDEDDRAPGFDVKGLEPSDLIVPAAVLLGAFVLISNVNQNRREKNQSREAWQQHELRKQGVSSKKQLSPYERRKLEEKEAKQFGKKRFRRKKS